MDELGGDGADGKAGGDEVVKQFVETEFGEGGGAAEGQHGRKNELYLNRARDGLAIGKITSVVNRIEPVASGCIVSGNDAIGFP